MNPNNEMQRAVRKVKQETLLNGPKIPNPERI